MANAKLQTEGEARIKKVRQRYDVGRLTLKSKSKVQRSKMRDARLNYESRTTHYEPGTMDDGQNGPRTTDQGQETTNSELQTINLGQRTKERGQWTTNSELQPTAADCPPPTATALYGNGCRRAALMKRLRRSLRLMMSNASWGESTKLTRRKSSGLTVPHSAIQSKLMTRFQ
jgi:hypothetical protein